MFVGRVREMQVLRAEFDNDRPSLVVMYGRRRVGKSTLLQEVLADRPHVYYQATRVADLDAQVLFKAQAARALGDDPVLEGLVGWEPILTYLRQVGAARVRESGSPFVVAIDEFPYLCEDNKALPSVVQKVWDEVRRSGDALKLVLCGSHVAFMEELLAEKNPLHGRQSRELDVGPLSLREAALMLPGWSAEDRLRAYGVFGGMPYYLSLCDPGQSLARNVRRLVLDDGAPLREEPMHLLQAELQAPARYASILRAVADGLTERGEIVNRVLQKGESSAGITPYIDRLERMRLLRRAHSLDVAAPERSRNARYYLSDPFLAFHFRFVLPNVSALQAGHPDAVYEHRIAPQLDGYMGDRFEEICRAYVALHLQERTGVPAHSVGKIWAADYDVDVAGETLDGRRLAGECKWWQKPVGVNVLRELEESAAKNRYYAGQPPLYAVFARAAFTPDLRKEAAARDDLQLVGAEDLLGESR
jgi:uncharacterized protein